MPRFRDPNNNAHAETNGIIPMSTSPLLAVSGALFRLACEDRIDPDTPEFEHDAIQPDPDEAKQGRERDQSRSLEFHQPSA